MIDAYTGMITGILPEFCVVDMRANGVSEVLTVRTRVSLVGMLAVMEIVVSTVAAIRLEFAVKVAYAVEVLGCVCGVLIGAVCAIGAEVNTNGLAASITALSLEEALPSCLASCNCCLLPVSDCDRTLQACKPSYHV